MVFDGNINIQCIFGIGAASFSQFMRYLLNILVLFTKILNAYKKCSR